MYASFALKRIEDQARPEPVDQAGWTARKHSLTLASGVRLACIEAGDPDGSPVLMLHGWTDNSRAWSLLAPYLAGHRLIIPDQRGHGASDKLARGYALSDFAKDALSLLDAKGISSASIVGHSLGSMVGQLIAAEHPDCVSNLVLVGSTALVPIRRGDWLWNELVLMTAAPKIDSDFFRAWSPAASPTPVDPDFLAHYEPEIAAIPLSTWQGVPRELAGLSIGRFANRVRARTLILSGGKDPLFPTEHHEALIRAIPHAEAHVFPELGHNLNMERPELLGPVLAAFLAG
jgi:pimeloyl-ACP methyl ester carboxylesterase